MIYDLAAGIANARRAGAMAKRGQALIKGAASAGRCAMRKATVKRTTKETDVAVTSISTAKRRSRSRPASAFSTTCSICWRAIPGSISTVKATGDLHIDHHHTTEDVGIALGQAVKQALGDMRGITRYADVHLPMDEALTRVAIDISGRPFLVFKVDFRARQDGHLRHRAGAGMVSGLRHERRR